MKYNPDEFTALVSAMERVGGALLPEKCVGTTLYFSKTPGGKDYPVLTCHCGNESKFVLPYQPIDATGKIDAEAMLKRGAGLVQICAVCDDVGRWPNFENVMEPEESE